MEQGYHFRSLRRQPGFIDAIQLPLLSDMINEAQYSLIAVKTLPLAVVVFHSRLKYNI
jgi:hypothetical protein